MKKRNLVAVMLVVAALILSPFAGYAQVFVGDPAVAVTEVSVTVGLGTGIQYISLANKGSNIVYAQAWFGNEPITSRVATTSSPLRLDPGDNYNMDLPATIVAMSFVCDAGKTSTIKVLGVQLAP